MHTLIYCCLLVFVALLVLNLFYMLRAGSRDRRHRRRMQKWKGQVEEALANGVTPYHQERLRRRLTNFRQLMSYQDAVDALADHPGIQNYLDGNHDVFQVLAAAYRHRPAVQRAYFAHVIACCHPGRGREHDQMAGLLLDFLDNSTVSCRQNVLLALCALGNSGAVEQTLRRFQKEGWYHNPRLLSDGLMTFFGNREALVRRLWTRAQKHEDLFRVTVVQFATQLSGNFAALFLDALQQGDTPLETRFALIRYFQRHPAPQARAVLQELALHPDGNGPAIAACAALAKYPGTDTVAVLEEALHSRSWNIRRNAAASLAELEVSRAELPRLAQSGDKYAAEILEYMQERRKAVGK